MAFLHPPLPHPTKPFHIPPKCTAQTSSPRIVIIGGGAAGHFAAISLCAQISPRPHVHILESSPRVLQKVRISGGGRCNVTSANDLHDARKFSANYPRGTKAMIGVLSRFGARDICDFFESHGVRLKVEPGGKVFPVSNKSQTVIDCLVRCVSQAGVKTLLRARVVDLVCREDGVYEAVLKDGRRFEAEYVLIATGGASMPHEWAKRMGHKIVDCVPSLFTFGIEDGRIRDLAGVSVSDCEVSLGKGFVQQGPLLITHWGLSGPVVLTLSSFAARLLSEREYVMDCSVDWIPRLKQDDKIAGLKAARVSRGGKKVVSGCPICAEFPKRLWRSLVISVGVEEDLRWADVSNKMMNRMAQVLDHCVFEVKKKGEFKEEFVVAGGIKLSGLDMKTFESRHSPRLYFAGETVDVDGRTGGYNLEFAWSSAYIAGAAIAQSIKSSREET